MIRERGRVSEYIRNLTPFPSPYQGEGWQRKAKYKNIKKVPSYKTSPLLDKERGAGGGVRLKDNYELVVNYVWLTNIFSLEVYRKMPALM